MADYTLGDFRRLTKDLPDDTPMVNSRWGNEYNSYCPCYLDEPEIFKFHKDSIGKESETYGPLYKLESNDPDAPLTIVIV